MKKICSLIPILLALALLFAASGCGRQETNSLPGTWEYRDEENGIGAVYVLKNDGTGTYTMTVGDSEVTYELKYEAKDGHLLVTYVNNEIFTEEDVFDSEFRFQDADTLIIKDTAGTEMTFIKK